MKRPLSRLEKLFLFVPIAGALLAWQWMPLVRALYQMFPRSVLQNSSGADFGQFSPDGELIYASRSNVSVWPRIDRATSVWEAKTGFRLWHFSSGHKSYGTDISPDSKFLVRTDWGSIAPSGVFLETSDANIRIFEARTGKVVRSFKQRGIYTARFVDNGRKLLCAGPLPRLLDAQTGKSLVSMPRRRISTFRPYLSDDRRVGVLMRPTTTKAFNFQQAEVWDFHAGRRVRYFPQKPWRGNIDFVLSPDGNWLFVWDIGRENKAELWDAKQGTLRRTLPLRDIFQARFAPDSRSLLITETIKPNRKNRWHQATLSDVRTGREIWRRTAPIEKNFGSSWMWRLRFLPNSKRIVSDGGRRVDLRGIFLLDARTGKTLHNVPLIDSDTPVAAPNSKSLVVSSGDLRIVPLPD